MFKTERKEATPRNSRRSMQKEKSERSRQVLDMKMSDSTPGSNSGTSPLPKPSWIQGGKLTNTTRSVGRVKIEGTIVIVNVHWDEKRQGKQHCLSTLEGSLIFSKVGKHQQHFHMKVSG